MNSFDRFKKRNGVYKEAAQQKLNTHFIFQGYPSTLITSGEKSIQAAVVHKDAQEEGYIFTPFATVLNIGSIWGVKNLKLLIDHEVTIIKDVNWHKYHYLVCNLQDNEFCGYFKGPEKSHINLTLHKDVVLTSQQKPILILAGQPLRFQDKIQIKGRGWIVDEYDSISTPGITYYSLMPATISKEIIKQNEDKDIFVESYKEPYLTIPEATMTEEGVMEITSNSQITIATENSYFKSSINSLKILKRNATEIIFEVPFGVSEFEIEHKEKGAIISQKYRVVK